MSSGPVVCITHAHVRRAVRAKADTGERKGVTLVTRTQDRGQFLARFLRLLLRPARDYKPCTHLGQLHSGSKAEPTRGASGHQHYSPTQVALLLIVAIKMIALDVDAGSVNECQKGPGEPRAARTGGMVPGKPSEEEGCADFQDLLEHCTVCVVVRRFYAVSVARRHFLASRRGNNLINAPSL